VAGNGTVDIDTMEFLLRAWTLARRISDGDLDRQARAWLAQIADDMITQHPGAGPGSCFPPWRDWRGKPVRAKKSPPTPDPIDVDDLLVRAAAACRRDSYRPLPSFAATRPRTAARHRPRRGRRLLP
jgi:hypothetical protein